MRRIISLWVYILILIHQQVYSQYTSLPIKPARTINFRTDEGSYMNIDVSPDGKTLVFDLLGDLYTVPSVGGKATQLTRGIALHLRPVWSPDGKWIAYISDASGTLRLNVMNLESSIHRVLGSTFDRLDAREDPIWTSDGNYIAIKDSLFGCIRGNYTAAAITSHPVRFSPTKPIFYGIDSNKLFKYDGYSKIAISSLLHNFRSAVLSPNGRWWCYITDSNSKRCLIAQDLVTNKTSVLVPALTITDPRYNAEVPSPHFSISPDSKSLFISYGGKIHRIELETGAVQVIPFTANVNVDLGALDYNTFRVNHDSLRVTYTRSANTSPDDKHLVFSALGKVYIMNLPNGKPHPLIDQPFEQSQPTYSSDGQWIAFVSWSDTAGGALWRVPAAGGKPEQLTLTSGQYQHPTWSPDGKFIAVLKAPPVFKDRDAPPFGPLELVSVADHKVRILADSLPLWNTLKFSSDGNRIIYTPKHERGAISPQLISTNLDGVDRQNLAVGTYLTFLSQKMLSPDGRYVVFSADEDLYLTPVCTLVSPILISQLSRQSSLIRFAAGVDPCWRKEGKILSWCYGNKYYEINPDKIMAKALKTVEKHQSPFFHQIDFISISVKPDLTIPINLRLPSFYAHGSLALRDVTIITMHGSKVIEHGTILIKDGRFAAVGPVSLIRIPPKDKVFDLSGTTVMPGLIDLHLHMRVPPDIFPQQSSLFLPNLAYGVTTGRDPSDNFDSFGYSELLKTGAMLGPRLYSVGRAARFPDGMLQCDNIEDTRALVQKRALFDGVAIKQYTLPTRIQREWLLLASHEAGLNMTNEGDDKPLFQLAMIKDGSTGIEHNPIWGDVYKDFISLLAKSATCLTPTLQVCYGAEEGKEYFKYQYWRQPDKKLARFEYSDGKVQTHSNGAESLETIMNAHPKDTMNPGFLTPARIDARILHAGGRICLGSHGNDEGIGAHNELWALQMGGMTNMEALQCATIRGAEALGVQQDLGSIEVGKIADLLILNKNPLDDIHNSREIRYVMKDGVLYDGNTLDEIWPDAKKCPDWHLHQPNN